MTLITPPTPQRLGRLRATLRVQAHLCFAGSMVLTTSSALLLMLGGAGSGLAQRLWQQGDKLRGRAQGLFTLAHPLAAALLRVRREHDRADDIQEEDRQGLRN